MSITERELPARIACETAARTLYDYLDGRLTPTTMEVVHEHLATCRICASHFDFARRMLDLVPAAFPLDDASPALRARIVESLKSEGYLEL